MSLFGSIQLGANALQATQIGLQVTGNNIANANTPGFIRERVIYSPAPVQTIGGLPLGLGVEIDAIVQQVDEFLLQRVRDAASDRASADVQRDALGDLETVIGELSDVDLSTSLSDFFNAIDNVALGEGDPDSLRNLAIGAGETLTANLRSLSTRTFELRGEFDRLINQSANDVNRLTEEIRLLNLRITTIEAGGASASDAGGLRTERTNALAELAELIDIQVNEQVSGAVNVSVGGDQLVFEATRREVQIEEATGSDGAVTSTLSFVDNGGPLQTTGGEVNGLLVARDEIAQGFIDNLDELTRTLAFEFNKLYSQGQGTEGFTSLTSVESVGDPSASLDEAGLTFTPTSGSFQLLVINPDEGASGASTTDIFIDLNGLDTDTTLSSLASDIDAVEGVSAFVDSSNRLVINADSPDVEFAFAGDPANESGVLAALGLNTFFTGDSAASVNVNGELTGGPSAAGRFAAGLGGAVGGGAVGQDNNQQNAVRLAEFFNESLEANGGASLATSYDQLINDVTQRSVIAQSVAEGFTSFEATLEAEAQAISGVSIDEEAVNLITLQRSFQASARFIQTISELLDVLVNL